MINSFFPETDFDFKKILLKEEPFNHALKTNTIIFRRRIEIPFVFEKLLQFEKTVVTPLKHHSNLKF